MATTFTLIKTVTVGSGGASSIDFTAIPATFTDLCLKVSARTGDATTQLSLYLSFNGSATSKSDKYLIGNGSATASGGGALNRVTWGLNGGSTTASTFGNSEVYIPSYLSSNYKSYSADGVLENNATAAGAGLTAGLWSNTAAINQITVTPESGSFVQYSSASLYGILKA